MPLFKSLRACLPVQIAFLFLLSQPDVSLQAREIKVGVYGSAPFVMQTDDSLQWNGVSLDIWRELARQKQLQFKLIGSQNLPAAIEQVSKGELDILVGPISVTHQRAQVLDFSHPWYQSWPGILVLRQEISPWAFVIRFAQTGFPIALGVLCLLLFITGSGFWYFERFKNHRLPEAFVPGVAKSMWFSLVTFTTVGYGDITPKSAAGRMLTSFWMLVSMLISSSITAVMATAFTLSGIRTTEISSPEDMRFRKVAVVDGTTGAEFARSHGAQLKKYQSAQEAVQGLVKGQVVAVCHDYPILSHQLRQYSDFNFDLIAAKYHQEDYAFAFRPQHPLRRTINLALLQMSENGTLQKIFEKYGIK